jgi:hypothetical protein
VSYDVTQGVAVVRLPTRVVARPEPWTPQRPERPRFLLAAETAAAGLYLRPVFVSTLNAATTPTWPGEIWILPPRTEIAPGAWLFTTTGQIVGLATQVGEQIGIVPTQLLIAEAEKLLAQDVLQAGVIEP